MAVTAAFRPETGRAASMLVYLDTNVFDNLDKKENEVTEEDELRLRTAVASGSLTIAFSHINIREILAALFSSPRLSARNLASSQALQIGTISYAFIARSSKMTSDISPTMANDRIALSKMTVR
jgi:hypothetical protein